MTAMKFSKKAKTPTSTKATRKWKVMIVDDEIEVHTITQAVLKDFDFEGDGILRTPKNFFREHEIYS